MDGGDDVEREALQLEAHVERDEAVRRDHHEHAERRQHDEHRELEAVHVFAADEAEGHDDGGDSGKQDQELHELGEDVHHEHAAEGLDRSVGLDDQQRRDEHEEANGADARFARIALAEDTPHEKRHGTKRHEDFRQGWQEVRDVGHCLFHVVSFPRPSFRRRGLRPDQGRSCRPLAGAPPGRRCSSRRGFQPRRR